jgi:polyisoprenoid-binding protein YceI
MKILTKTLLVLGVVATGIRASESPWKFVIDSEASRFTVDVGKAGLFKIFGHDHVIDVTRFEGSVSWYPDDPESSTVQLEIDGHSLTVADEGIDAEERAEIQSDMEAQALVLEQYPRIVFRSRQFSLKRRGEDIFRGSITGELSLRGETRSVEVPVEIHVSEEKLTASGELELRGSDFGVPQIKAAGGTVKTKDELKLAFEIVATRGP